MHGDGRKMPYVMIEVRQDLIATNETQDSWAERLFYTLKRAGAEYYSQE
jgi:predicted N-formylglutamate amidohydrolase